MSRSDRRTILVAMSGGVDSSVAAALLVKAGHRVIGATMKTFCYSDTPGPSRTCCGLEGIMDARAVCDTLGIPHYVFDLEEEFTRAVIDDFVTEYAAGRTPNPCVRCNSNTKLPDLLRKGRMLGADAVATGHYARISPPEEPGGAPRIRRGLDARKDQSYFLWGVPKAMLPYLEFPVGELTKSEVRAMARELGLATADKPESQEICFVPTNDYTDFLAQRLGSDHPALSPGALVTTTGEVIGQHGGYARYTVGQRKGLGGGHRRPLYVLGVRPATNEVVVGSNDELYRADVTLADLNWLDTPPVPGERVKVQVRYRARAVDARVISIGPDRVQLELDEPERAITPGQSGAVYRDDILVGGGRIR
ncbi:MAG TPA: tRNA 2-thiouridine(34) synthase MnmA [Longimicrobiales bacterium]|nr:tRNA 2-thiouridine(34) synthase MnmA [Longimicrobiales bacterium]